MACQEWVWAEKEICAVCLVSCLGTKNGGGVLFVLLWGFLLGWFVFLLYHGIKWEVLGRCTWGQGGQSTAKAV